MLVLDNKMAKEVSHSGYFQSGRLSTKGRANVAERELNRAEFEKLSKAGRFNYNKEHYPQSTPTSYWVQKIPYVPNPFAGRPFHIYSLGRRPVSNPVFCLETISHEPSPLRGRPFTVHSVRR